MRIRIRVQCGGELRQRAYPQPDGSIEYEFETDGEADAWMTPTAAARLLIDPDQEPTIYAAEVKALARAISRNCNPMHGLVRLDDARELFNRRRFAR